MLSTSRYEARTSPDKGIFGVFDTFLQEFIWLKASFKSLKSASDEAGKLNKLYEQHGRPAAYSTSQEAQHA